MGKDVPAHHAERPASGRMTTADLLGAVAVAAIVFGLELPWMRRVHESMGSWVLFLLVSLFLAEWLYWRGLRHLLKRMMAQRTGRR
jgi:hypothetical protein